jgi:predicted RNase H-like HicB family nuclease
MKYAVVYEKSSNGWGAFVPDLPGCVALGFTLEEAEDLIRGAVEQHIRAMREDGAPVREPSHVVDTLEIA